MFKDLKEQAERVPFKESCAANQSPFEPSNISSLKKSMLECLVKKFVLIDLFILATDGTKLLADR